MATPDVRVVAVRVLATLLDGGGSLSRLLPGAADSVPAADRALLHSLCFDLARWLPRLEALLEPLLDKPLRRKDEDVRLLLLLGLLQLTERRMPVHAAVDTAVRAAGKLRKPWARGLVNGVLRNFQRRAPALLQNLSPAAALACPEWMLARFQHDWPTRWQSIAEAGNLQAPMVLRVNTRRGSRASWLARAAEAGIQGYPVVGLDSAVQLVQPQAVEVLPGFADGAISVQDGAAQYAAGVLRLWQDRHGDGNASSATGGTAARQEGAARSGARLLDACAAPGGKTAHALESFRSLPTRTELDDPPTVRREDTWDEVVALDHDAERLARARQTLERLGLLDRATLIAGDAADTTRWWDSRPFDAVLLDAPCSASGVIRRHPDIKLLRRSDDLHALTALQARLLDALWPVVAPGGCLLYVTCSVFKAENEHQVASFMARHDDIELFDPCTLAPMQASDGQPDGPWGERRPTGRQLFPGEGGMDGFFYALLGKVR